MKPTLTSLTSRPCSHCSSSCASLTDDVLRQAEGSVKYPNQVVIFVVWLYGTLMLSERVSGYIIMLLGGVICGWHDRRPLGGGVVHPSSGFFFVLTLFALTRRVGSPRFSRPVDCD